MEGSNLTYWLLLAVAVAILFVPGVNRSRSWQRTVAVGLFTLALGTISTLRYDIGFDYSNYLPIFKNIAELPWQELKSAGVEMGFCYLMKAFTLISPEPVFLFGVISFFVMIPIGITIYRYSTRPGLSFFLLITLQYFALSMNFMRQAMAMSLAMLAMPFLEKKKIVPYMAIVLLAATIHKSALVLVVAYFIAWIPITKITLALYGAGTVAALVFSESIMSAVTRFAYGSYAEGKFYEGSEFRMVVFSLIIFAACIPLGLRLIKRRPEMLPYVNFMIYGTFFTLMFVRHFILERFALYFTIQVIVLLPLILDTFQPAEAVAPADGKFRSDREEERRQKKAQKEQRQIQVAIGIGLCLCGVLHCSMAMNEGYHNTYPYHSLFSDYAKEKERVPYVSILKEQQRIEAAQQAGGAQ